MSVNDVCIGVALCGLGRMGMIHAENILRNGRMKFLYIVEVDKELSEKVIKDRRLVETTKFVHFKDFDTALQDKDLHAVIIATPTHKHLELVQKALIAGKHVLCEKPLSKALNETIQCYNLAKENNLILLCAFNRRFDPNLSKMVNSKEIGKLLTISICSRDAQRPSLEYLKTSGGIFHDCLVHGFDALRWITGENPETIFSVAHCHDPEIAALDDADTVFVTLKFPSGVLARLEAQRECVYGYDQTYEMYGTNGNLVCSNPRKTLVMRNGSRIADEMCSDFGDRFAQSYILELEHLADLIQKKVQKPAITGNDTVQATCLCQAAEDSWRENRVIVVKKYVDEMLGKCDNKLA